MAEDGTATLSVGDNGVGMASDAVASLGHQIVRALVAQIDGRLTIERERGTTVTVTFPG